MYILFWVLAILCFSYYAILVSYAGIWSAFIGFWLAAGIGFSTISIALRVDNKIHFLCKIPKFIMYPMSAAIIAGCILVTFLFGCVVSKMCSVPKKHADYIIVLGAQIRGEYITKPLRFRLEAAMEYYNAIKDDTTKIIVSGGQGTGEACSESVAMKKYLIEHGIADDCIILEDQSTTTKENLEFSYRLICEEGKENANVVICSNNFHIFRAVQLAKHLGIVNVEGLAAKCDPLFLPNYMVRDSLAIFKEFLLGNLGW